MDDKKSFALAMGELQMKCQGELSKEKLAAYWQDLSNYTLEQVVMACRALATQPGRVFFPTVGEFIEVLEGTVHEKALGKWQKLIKAVEGGYWRECNFSEATQAGIDAAGGIDRIRHCESKWLHMVRKDFIAGYETAAKRQQHEQIAEVLNLPVSKALS